MDIKENKSLIEAILSTIVSILSLIGILKKAKTQDENSKEESIKKSA